MKRKKSCCLILSLCLHGLAVCCLQKYSLWFTSIPVVEEENWLSLIDKNERDQILKTSFSPHTEVTSQTKNEPAPENVQVVMTSQIKEECFEQKTDFSLAIYDSQALITAAMHPTFPMLQTSFNLLDHLPKDLILPIQQPRSISPYLPTHAETSISLLRTPAHLEETPQNGIRYLNEFDFALIEQREPKSAANSIPLSHLHDLPTLADLNTTSCSDSFDTDLVFIPKEDGHGYLFALTLIPRADLHLPRLKQNITFLIDRSNAIQQNRLTATKSAIIKAMEALNEEDTFNLIAFDSKMDKMSPHYLPCNQKSAQVAEDFLSTIHLGSFFAASDLQKPLFLTVPGQVAQNEIHTAILLTDGETMNKKAVQKALFDWTAYNEGKVSLFIIGMHDLQSLKLDALANLNRGKLINSPTHRGMKRKLLKLLKSIQSPIAKNISCHAISRSSSGVITLLPKDSQMPNLYIDQPYTILGETETLDDFYLFVQGRLKDKWLNIKKNLSFLNAKKGTKALKVEWAEQMAYQLYEQYANDENPKHIADAKRLLEPFDRQAAFQ